MNEWSPGGNYSCPATPNQVRRSFRSQRDDYEKGTKLSGVNARGVSENKNKSSAQRSMEEISRVVPGNNRKGGGNSTADPRFKRVIPPGVQNNNSNNGGGEAKTQKSPLVPDESETAASRFPIWSNTEFKTNKSWVDCLKDPESNFKQNESQKLSSASPELFSGAVSPTSASATGPNQPSEDEQIHEHLKGVDKLSFNHTTTIKSMSKESLSEWTVNSRNNSLVSEDRIDFSNTLGRIPSSTRVKKVQNWIFEQRPKLEKKHSVITVIGQMQEPDSLSSALQEIDKRRKLVKELDKFAVCKRLIATEKEKEISDMINKIKSAHNDGILYSCSNETINTSSQSMKFFEDKSHKNALLSSNGKFQMLFSSFSYQKMFYIFIFICGILCWFAFFSIENGPYVTFDLFSSKPKPVTWYERICNWLWELFRPSGLRKGIKFKKPLVVFETNFSIKRKPKEVQEEEEEKKSIENYFLDISQCELYA